MKGKIAALIGIALAWTAGIATAQPVPFYDVKEGYVFDASAGATEKTWVFDLNKDQLLSTWDGHGMDPFGEPVDINAEDKITAAWIEINFYEDDPQTNANGKEKVAVREYADLIADETVLFQNREIDTGYIHRKIDLSLLDDHLLSVTITADSGNFEVYNLFVGGAFKDVAPVPEPGTTLLFGLGLVGLAAAGRKKIGC